MKKAIFILAFLCLIITTSTACEICGCSTGNYYMGLLPNYKSHFISIRYSSIRYNTVLADDASEFSHDYYRTTELAGGINIGTRWQLMGIAPYLFNEKSNDNGTQKKNGLGDITLMGKYLLFHQLWLGAGIKLPTGVYSVDHAAPDANIGDANAQPGTGSTDFLLTASHNFNIGKLGVQSSGLYKINTTNQDQYHFGNKLFLSSLAYYRFKQASIIITPSAGLQYEYAAGNHFQKEPVEFTGGQILHANLGTEFSYKKLALGIIAQLPLAQNFAEGQTVSRPRVTAQLSFVF